MPINTLYHLIDDVARSPRLLEIADQFLTIADYLHFLFNGVAVIEESLASTTQIYNPRKGAWFDRLIETFGFPRHTFPRIVPSGTRLGPLLPEVSAETDADALEVIATCSHDTGSAVAAVPATGLSRGSINCRSARQRCPPRSLDFARDDRQRVAGSGARL